MALGPVHHVQNLAIVGQGPLIAAVVVLGQMKVFFIADHKDLACCLSLELVQHELAQLKPLLPQHSWCLDLHLGQVCQAQVGPPSKSSLLWSEVSGTAWQVPWSPVANSFEITELRHHVQVLLDLFPHCLPRGYPVLTDGLAGLRDLVCHPMLLIVLGCPEHSVWCGPHAPHDCCQSLPCLDAQNDSFMGLVWCQFLLAL